MSDTITVVYPKSYKMLEELLAPINVKHKLFSDLTDEDMIDTIETCDDGCRAMARMYSDNPDKEEWYQSWSDKDANYVSGDELIFASFRSWWNAIYGDASNNPVVCVAQCIKSEWQPNGEANVGDSCDGFCGAFGDNCAVCGAKVSQ